MSTDPPPFDPAGLLQDWITLWQSEAAGLSQDREMHENWARLAEIWTQPGMRAAMRQAAGYDWTRRSTAENPPRGDTAENPPRGDTAENAPGGAGTDGAARAAATADAHDAQREVAALRADISDLRQRLERLERLETVRRRKQRSPPPA